MFSQQILESLKIPEEIAIVHVPDHQKGTTEMPILGIWAVSMVRRTRKSPSQAGSSLFSSQVLTST
jgi:hypothetical protein